MNGIPSFSLFTASSNKFHKFCIVFLSTCMNEGNDRAQYGVFEDLDTEYFSSGFGHFKFDCPDPNRLRFHGQDPRFSKFYDSDPL